MAVYVDTMQAKYKNMVMCHMMADSTSELLEMADRIGVDRKWLQKEGDRFEHFDICQTKKKLAIGYGAILLSQKDLVKKFRNRIKPS